MAEGERATEGRNEVKKVEGRIIMRKGKIYYEENHTYK